MAEESATPATKQTPAKKTAKKSTAKKSTAKKSAVKKSPVKKSAVKKSAAKKTTAKGTAAKKSTATKTTAKKSAKQTTAQRTPAKQATAGLTPQRVVEAVRDTSAVALATAAATGKAAVGRATAATQKPVEAGRQLFTAAQTRAKDLVVDPAALRGLADQALHSKSGRSGPMGELADEFRTLGRLVAAYSRGDYRDIPLDSLLMVVAGLVYVVSPLDLIPEAVPVAGYADDVVAVGFVIRQVHHELAAFREWEAKQG